MPGYDHAADLNRRLLRFGIVCDGEALESWQLECMGHILKTGRARFTMAVIVEGTAPRPRNGAIRSVFYSLYLNRLRKIPALNAVELDAVLQGRTKLSCRGGEGGLSISFTDDDIRDIRLHSLDFVLNFSSRAITGDVLNAVKYGVWSFSHGGTGRSTPCISEVMAGDQIAVSALEKSTPEAHKTIILRHGVFKAYKAPLADNINSIYREIARWPAQVCTDITDGRAGYLNGNPVERKARRAVAPGDLRVSLFAARVLKNYLGHLASKYVIHEDWNVGIVYAPIHAFLAPGAMPEVRWLAHPKKRFWADPFGIVRGGELNLFCEDYDYGRMKGSISAIKLSPEAPPRPETIIDNAVHMSYPFVLESGGEIYCIPETSRAGEICVYKALDFPDRWARVCAIIENFEGADPTVFKYNGLWWLFCTDKRYDGILNLFIWYSRDLLGPWQPHKLNPVKTDVRSARPAGTPFVHDGELYRPSQDCSGTYGGRVVINRIVKLTTADFEEEAVKAIGPYRDSIYRDGIHTLSACGDMTLVDGKRNTVDPLILKNTLLGYSIKFVNKYLTCALGHRKVDDRRNG